MVRGQTPSSSWEKFVKKFPSNSQKEEEETGIKIDIRGQFCIPKQPTTNSRLLIK